MKNSSLIIDTDGGIDDALAVLALVNSKEADIKLINVTAGNVDNVQAYKNISAVLNLCGKKISLSLGQEASFSGKLKRPYNVHGSDGLGDTFLSKDIDILNTLNAPTAFKEAIETGVKKIFSAAPLTNVADFFLEYPELISQLEEVWLTGGVLKSGADMSAEGEFNFYFDPKAVEIVFSAGVEAKVVTMDVTKSVLFGRDFIKNFEGRKEKTFEFISRILNFSYEFNCNNKGLNGAHLPDLVSACIFLDKNLADFEKVKVVVGKNTGCLFKNQGGKDILTACNLKEKQIKEKALDILLGLKGREV
ncbi:MAG: nucleoside hydrolase [Candidatus Omnitrophota bacterium]